uniref:Uncharacterized protein n=1 Tax=Kalanchoe fedtschenkoi TaxID=63787 RepID=A0A7N0TCP8_KALFE
MAFYILVALAALCVAFVVSQAALPGEIYWDSVLPNTPMPRAISNVLEPGYSVSASAFDVKFSYKTASAGKGDEAVPDLRRLGYNRRGYNRRGYNRRHYTLESENDGEEAVPDLRRVGYNRRGYNRAGYNRWHRPSTARETGKVDLHDVLKVKIFTQNINHLKAVFLEATSDEEGDGDDDDGHIPESYQHMYHLTAIFSEATPDEERDGDDDGHRS